MKTNFFNWILSAGILLFAITSCNKKEPVEPQTAKSVSRLKAASATSGSGVFGGGPIYMNRSVTIPELKASGFTHVIVWTIHIESNGDMGFNGEFPLCSNGSYIGNSKYPNFPSDMASLKTGTTSVIRVEFGLSGWGSGTFANIKSLIASQGTGSGSILYRNFQALKAAIPAVDAINFDDESTYDVASSVQFAVMIGNLGYKVVLCPYTNSSYWTSVASQTNSQRPGTVDLVMLQCYAGGSGNSPCNWNFSGIPVWGSRWSGTPSSVQSAVTGWKNTCGTPGAFMWLYDEWVGNGMAAQYANAINTAIGGTPPVGTDITNSGGTISAQYTDSPAAEVIAKLIDNSTATKYLTFHSAGWVQFQPTTGAVVVKYTITSANDVPARDPKNWTLQGSNNGTSWTTLDTRTNQTFASRFLTKTYTFTNTTSYTYYRLNVTAVQSGSTMQIAEWELWKN